MRSSGETTFHCVWSLPMNKLTAAFICCQYCYLFGKAQETMFQAQKVYALRCENKSSKSKEQKGWRVRGERWAVKHLVLFNKQSFTRCTLFPFQIWWFHGLICRFCVECLHLTIHFLIFQMTWLRFAYEQCWSALQFFWNGCLNHTKEHIHYTPLCAFASKTILLHIFFSFFLLCHGRTKNTKLNPMWWFVICWWMQFFRATIL